MKYRIKNIKTGNYISRPTDYQTARNQCNVLNEAGEKYRVVNVGDDIQKMSVERKPMSEDVKKAISQMKKISYASGRNDSAFANVLITRVGKGELQISEKEEAYMWAIIYHYRRQIGDQKLIVSAKQNKVI